VQVNASCSRLCSLCFQPCMPLPCSPCAPQDMKVEAILRSGIRRFTDEVRPRAGLGWGWGHFLPSAKPR
jgi:hypothetical protein